jgi:alanyl-tRNA synthetase
MQYDRNASGDLKPLPKPSIDTGMGLERISAVLQGKSNNFDSDLFHPLISAIMEVSQKVYGRDVETDTAMRVIADHMRAIAFLLSEGLIPSNEGRGYVLRRIIRRASRYTKKLDISDPVLYTLCDPVIASMGNHYPELLEEQARIRKILRLEEERFSKTLEHGLTLLNTIVQNIKDAGMDTVPGSELFRLYDTYGFPLDIARDVAEESSLNIDEDGFHQEMELQKTKARASWTGEEAGASPVYRDMLEKYQQTEFMGYESTEADATVLEIIVQARPVDEVIEGIEAEILLARTPFYAESGGQAGDTGLFLSDSCKASVHDTVKPVEGMFIHKILVTKGVIRKGDRVHSSVDLQKRHDTMRNHTATHLLHSALRKLLGEHVKQAGSYVAHDRFRFDFTHFNALDEETLEALEDEVNENILRNLDVNTRIMETEDAIGSGAIALFGEKYGDMVRTVSIPDVSTELCGGTHVHATGDIGLIKILSEGSLASGIRRIEAVTGKGAIEHLRSEERELRKISDLLKSPDNPSEKLSKLLSDMKELEKSLEKYKGKAAAEGSSIIIDQARDINGVRAVAYRVDGLDQKDLRIMADNIRDGLGSGIMVLASVKNGQAALVAMVTKDLAGRFNAGAILKQVASSAGGRGGGKADLAQGGTKDIKKLDSALESLYDIIKKQL